MRLLCRLLFLAFANHSVVYQSGDAARIIAPALDPQLAKYEEQYVAKPESGTTLARARLLHRLGVLKGPAPDRAEPPRIVKIEAKPRHHGDGGTYTREIDQYGDQYGVTIDGPSTRPELSRIFNVPRLSPDLPNRPARFLRDAARGFPAQGLTAEELALLEPLPQRDPLRSYLGCALVRMYTRDGDKPMPPYDPEVKAHYVAGSNYYRRADGTYYIYDLPAHRLSEYDYRDGHLKSTLDPPRENMEGIVNALRAAPDKKKAIEFYLDTLFAFPGIGRDQILHDIATRRRHDAAYEAGMESFRELQRSMVFRAAAGIAGTQPPEPPKHRLDLPYTYVRDVEGFFLMPLFMERMHRELGPRFEEPELMEALAQRNEAYRKALPDFLKTIEKDLPPKVASALRARFEALAEGKPLPRL